MTYFWDPTPGTRPLGQPLRPAGVTVVLAAENARRTLDAGVTTGSWGPERDRLREGRSDQHGPHGRATDVRGGPGTLGPARRRAAPRLQAAGRGARGGRIGLGQGLRLARQ